MSSDGIRKATLGWQISPTGGMTNNAGGIVEINEMAPVPSGSIAIDSGAIIVDEPPPLPAPRADMETRSRKNTIERFNDEMAVLDRPLEGEVEYIDEKPPRRWRHLVAFAATVAIVGGGGAYLLSHHRAAIAAASAEQAPSAPQPVQAQAPAPAQPVLATQVTPAPGAAAAPAIADAPAEGDSADDDAEAAPVAPSAWSKVKAGHDGGRVKHARVVTSKTHHRTSKRTVAAKHARHR